MPLARVCALVTGSSHGVGAAVADYFVAHGARVVLHAGRDLQRAEQLARDLGPLALGALQVDLAERGAGSRLFAAADALAAGQLNTVINNAGIFIDSRIDEDEQAWLAAWQRTLQVNLQAVADISRAAINAFRRRGGGSLIAIASRAGQRGDDAEHSAYAASKGGVLALTKTLARGFGRDSILAYAIAPGWVDTRMAPQDDAGRAHAAAEIPLGRMASSEEIAAACAFLASGACPSATGSCLDINGASYVR
jgi:NAD(P)-dependent dehydrogenase (short-subunit alcohol dehydrogenase family)